MLPLASTWQRHRHENCRRNTSSKSKYQHNVECFPGWLSEEDSEWTGNGSCECHLDDAGTLRPIPDSGEFKTPILLLVFRTWDLKSLFGLSDTTQGCIELNGNKAFEGSLDHITG
jgi:hypothetical protein